VLFCAAGYLHDNRKAQKAAYRRAADLLQACGAARRRQEGAAAADGAYEGALGLTRKLHYTGYVQVRWGCLPCASLSLCMLVAVYTVQAQLYLKLQRRCLRAMLC
jgi:hypothetical protein